LAYHIGFNIVHLEFLGCDYFSGTLNKSLPVSYFLIKNSVLEKKS